MKPIDVPALAEDSIRPGVGDARDVVEVVGVVEPEPRLRVREQLHHRVLGIEVERHGEGPVHDGAKELAPERPICVVADEG